MKSRKLNIDVQSLVQTAVSPGYMPLWVHAQICTASLEEPTFDHGKASFSSLRSVHYPYTKQVGSQGSIFEKISRGSSSCVGTVGMFQPFSPDTAG